MKTLIVATMIALTPIAASARKVDQWLFVGITNQYGNGIYAAGIRTFATEADCKAIATENVEAGKRALFLCEHVDDIEALHTHHEDWK
jgi:hypothetical protein